MNSTLSIHSSFSTTLSPPPLRHRSSAAAPILRPPHILTSHKNLTIKATASSNPPNPSFSALKAAAIFTAAAAFAGFHHFPARAQIPSPPQTQDSVFEQETAQESPLTQFLESSPEAIAALKKLLQEKLETGEDEEGLSILAKLSCAQPENAEWMFLKARVLNEMGRVQEARDAFEEILGRNPLSFEALFENALLMDRSGERELVMGRLEKALRVAEEEGRAKEARNVRLIMAQMQFLHKNVDEAMRSYDELLREDPTDFRPYFCKGMIFSLMDKNAEAREQFAKYRELSPKKFEVEGYLRSPLSRMKLFGAGEEN